MYYQDEDGNVYYESSEQPSQAFTADEWAIEKERLITHLQSMIAGLEIQLDMSSGYVECPEDANEDIIRCIDFYNNMKNRVGASNILIELERNRNLLDDVIEL